MVYLIFFNLSLILIHYARKAHIVYLFIKKVKITTKYSDF